MKGNEAEQLNIETRQTSWEELSISNDFLFGKVMQILYKFMYLHISS